MDDGDGCFDLDNLEYASDFRAPTDHSSGEAFVMIQGDSLDRARFRCGSTGRETVAQPVKDRQPFQARQWFGTEVRAIFSNLPLLVVF